VPGNNLTRNFLIAFSGILATTAIAVPAETWQIDFNARLWGIDERERLSNYDIYDHEAFLDTGWNVERVGATTTYDILPGIGYVGGIRIASAITQQVTVAGPPKSIWLDVSLQGDISDVSAVVDFIIDAIAHADYTDGLGFNHFVTKIAEIAADGSVTDVRVTHPDFATVAALNEAINRTSIQGAFKNLQIDALGVNNYNCVITADEVVLENDSNQYLTVRAINKTVNANGVVGAPLSIMSARATSTWYYRWLWYNTVNGLTATLDLSSTAPTAPTGYTASDYKALLPGACRTDATGSSYLLQITTRGKRSQYVVKAGSNVPAYPLAVSGVQGTMAATIVYVAVSVSSFIPPTASILNGVLQNNYSSATLGMTAIASNPDITTFASSGFFFVGINGGATGQTFVSLLLESASVYFSGGAAGSAFQVIGWEDEL
jgi:hypothetical protein